LGILKKTSGEDTMTEPLRDIFICHAGEDIDADGRLNAFLLGFKISDELL
jgi:hypothetical protein